MRRPSPAFWKAVAAMGILFSAAGTAADIPEITLPLTTKPPVIDGVIGEKEWAAAGRVIGFMRNATDLEPRDGVFWLTADDASLYIAVRTETPPVRGLLARAKPSPTNDVPAYYDDSLELWIDPHREKPAGDRRYFQIIVNSLGALYDIAYDPADKQQKAHTGWRVEWAFASKIVDGMWHVEIAIPLSSIGATAADLAGAWGIRIGRNWQQPSAQSEWAPFGGAFEEQKTMPVVRWNREAPVSRLLSIRNPAGTEPLVAMEVRNPGVRKVEALVEIVHQSSSNPPRTVAQTVVLGAGESRTVSLPDATHRGRCVDTVRVTERPGGRVLFLRTFAWEIERPEKLWSVASDEAKAVTLDFGYYPYHNKVKARLDIGGLSAKSGVSGARLAVRNKAGAAMGETAFPPFRDDVSETVLSLPPLKAGDYVVEAVLSGGAGVPREPVRREFVRKVFEWEHNTLGITDAVIPPFTPIAVKGTTVSTVLREHRMNNLGLWDQVVSEGVPILAGPMSIEVSIGGRRQTVTAGSLRFTGRTPTGVSFETSWKAGTMAAGIAGTYETDGMMKLAMTLTDGGNEPVDAVDLVIPLDRATASLMHVCTDGLRVNYAGDIPKGDGLVWESKRASRLRLPGTFVPYLWVGNEKQGLCWIADSDRDWIVDDKTSTHEIRRLPDRTEVRVRFVTAARPLGRRRTLVFALQATPTKPMPEKPVPWRQWALSQGLPNHYNITCLGSCYYWGSWTPCGDVFPRDRDTSFYDLMAEVRRTGTVDRTKVDAWMAGYGTDTPAYKNTYLPHIEYTMRAMQGRPAAVVPYTNARGTAVTDEFLTFQDEWLIYPYTNRKWDTANKGACGVCYEASPVRSYQDFCLWWFKKMLDSRAMDGVYFDDIFLQSSFDIVSGGAYTGDDGALRPSADLFAMREYLKRVQTLVCQSGRPWLNISHMTNTQIVPINTWVGMNLDWEWKYGTDDFQDRWSRDFIRAQTLGIQSGSIPTILLGITGTADKEKIAWCARTQLGVALVHEIKLWGFPVWTADYPGRTILTAMRDFGYGEPDCRIYRYWDKGFPVTVTGTDASSILLERNGALFLVVTDYGEGGTCTVALDARTLAMKAGGTFVDVETGKPIGTQSAGGCRFDLKKHDFKAIVYR